MKQNIKILLVSAMPLLFGCAAHADANTPAFAKAAAGRPNLVVRWTPTFGPREGGNKLGSQVCWH